MYANEKHPDYVKFVALWEKMRDTYSGEETVKEKGATYLPPTEGMVLDGFNDGADSLGRQAYDAYRMRAIFHDFVSEGIETYLGMIFNRAPVVQLPPEMEYLRESATNKNETIILLLRRIYEQVLITGRVGLLLDLPSSATVEPKFYVATYEAERILNWDDADNAPAAESDIDTLRMVVLDESGPVRKGFSWEEQTKFRILSLGDAEDTEGVEKDYQQVVQTQDRDDLTIIPVVRGKKLNKLPFVMCNPNDIAPSPDRPPLLGLANLTLAIYRGEADYRQTLFLTGQDTLVVSGAVMSSDTDRIRVGNNAAIHIEDPQGKAEYVGVSGQGLSEQRLSLETDRKRAEAKAGHLAAASKGDKESGDALRTRVNAQSASLKQISITGAAALEYLLRIGAEWLGADPQAVRVIPNVEFADDVITGQDVERIMAAKVMGAPLAMTSIHAYFAKKGLTGKTYEQELTEIASEDPLPANSLTGMGNGGVNDDADTE